MSSRGWLLWRSFRMLLGMERRKFIKLVSETGLLMFVPTVLTGCGSADQSTGAPADVCLAQLPPSSDPFDSWAGPAADESDIRVIVLSYASLAPNPHNIQPWLIRLRGASEFDVYVDRDRLLPKTDPPFRQIHIGHGCFLELLEIAAKQHGYRAAIEYFPEGMYANDALEDRPVARVTLREDADVIADPLFASITRRSTNRAPYSDRQLEPALLERLASDFSGPERVLRFATDAEQRDRLSELAVQGIRVEVADYDRLKETTDTWRLTAEELLVHRSGTDARAMAAELMLSREVLLDPNTVPLAVELAGEQLRAQASTAAAYGWVTTSGNTRLQQLEVGRAYARLHLTATELGISMGPFSQLLQEFDDMRELQSSLKAVLGAGEPETVQMLFRIGYAEAAPHSARRRVTDFSSC